MHNGIPYTLGEFTILFSFKGGGSCTRKEKKEVKVIKGKARVKRRRQEENEQG